MDAHEARVRAAARSVLDRRRGFLIALADSDREPTPLGVDAAASLDAAYSNAPVYADRDAYLAARFAGLTVHAAIGALGSAPAGRYAA